MRSGNLVPFDVLAAIDNDVIDRDVRHESIHLPPKNGKILISSSRVG